MAWRRALRRVLAAAAAGMAALCAGAPPQAGAAAPDVPQINEPVAEGAEVNASDVHMEAYGYFDPDGDPHQCSEWEIVGEADGLIAWESLGCLDPPYATHAHFGNGTFLNAHAGRTELLFGAGYLLRVRFQDDTGEFSPWTERRFVTRPLPLPGTDTSLPWVPREPGYAVELVAGGFQLPVNVAFVPRPGSASGSPLLYVSELYGSIKTVTRAGAVLPYRAGLLNFNPLGDFPGTGEIGLAGLTVHPTTGDVLATLVYESAPGSGTFWARVIRMHSTNGGLTGGTPGPILDLGTDLPPEPQAPSHQISNLTVGPDGNLYLHQGDGFDADTALDLDSYMGKILRFDLDGQPIADNPHYDAGDGIGTRDYIWAHGFRNPFGGVWRTSNDSHYIAENGPSIDRLTRADLPQPPGGLSWGWNGSDASMTTQAIYNWNPAQAPVNIAMVQDSTFGGSGFPDEKLDHAFVTLSGPTYGAGPQPTGKRIVEFGPGPTGELTAGPTTLVEYDGIGKATAVGLAAGQEGLYFTELYKDLDYTSPIDAGARLLRIHYYPPLSYCTLDGRRLEVSLPAPRKKAKGNRANRRRKKPVSRGTVRVRGDRIYVNNQFCGATVDNVNTIDVTGAGRSQELTIDLREGSLVPGATVEDEGLPDLEVTLDLKGGRDMLILIRRRGQSVKLSRRGAHLNADEDQDVFATGVERAKLLPKVKRKRKRR